MIRTNKDLERYIFVGILCAQGIILGLIEQSFPPIFAFAPGAKLGFTNVITLLALVILPFKDCILLTFLRLTTTALISGGVSTFIYAATGAFLSLFLMKLALLAHPRLVSLIGVSILGGVSHNFGQLLVASLIAQSKYVMLYLPLLTFSGIVAGILVGFGVKYLLPYTQAITHVQKGLLKNRKGI